MSDLNVGSLSAIGAPLIGALPTGTNATGASDPAIAATVVKRSDAHLATSTQAPAAAPMVQTGSLDAGDQPIDIDRVAAIRNAIASGHYPLVPAQIGDAMIAAGILLQSGTA